MRIKGSVRASVLTFLTRLGACGADAFSIKRIAGHSSVTISEKYIYPTPESVERVFERLEEYNTRSLKEGPKLLEAATVSATALKVDEDAA